MKSVSHDQQKSNAGLCALCLRNADLQKSHIIPKFVGKYLKNTFGTKYLIRGADTKRVQDLFTHRLLCSDCEQRFSRLEKYFADTIFYPYHKNGVERLEYDNKLKLFAFSLSWRALKIDYKEVKSMHPEFGTQMEQAESIWRKFLLGYNHTVCPYESHLFLMGRGKSATSALDTFDLYSLRSVDCTVATGNRRMCTLVKLADIVFVTSIHPTVLKGWKGTLINESGRIPNSCIIGDGEFGRFLFNHVGRALASLIHPSQETQQKRIQTALNNDAKKFLESDIMQINMNEMISHYKQKMGHMSDQVIWLVDVIENQMNRTKVESVVDVLNWKEILDALVGLSVDEAAMLDNGIRTAREQLFATGRSTKYRLKANSIWITFMANNNSTTADQHAAIYKEHEKLVAERSSVDIPIAIFSMNDEGNGVSFESTCMVTRQHYI